MRKNLDTVDIQSYAAAKILPHVDYYLARENLDSFKSKNNEPVGVLMNAWWMWEKWNWPPAECIYPYMISMHINNYGIRRKSSPIQTEWLQGIGGEYFKAYEPIGCRDETTINFLKENNIKTYFSGCLTLTLPKQKITSDTGTYVCLVDLKPELEKKAREYLENTGLEIRTITHNCDYRKSDISMEERFKIVEEILTQYQNAKVVITRRLHVTLPCLAMGVPVVSIVNLDDAGNYTRWAPYSDWVNYISEKDFMSHTFDYDFMNPKTNKMDYLETRNSLIKSVNIFIDKTNNCELPIEKIKKTHYTEIEARKWQNELMHWTLDTWLHKNRGLLEERNKFKKERDELKKKIEEMNELIKNKEKKIEQLIEKYENIKMKDYLKICYKKIKGFIGK